MNKVQALETIYSKQLHFIDLEGEAQMGQCPTQGHVTGGRGLLIATLLNLTLGFSLGVDEKHAPSHWITRCSVQIFTSNSVQEAK